MLLNKDTARQKSTFDCPVFVAESRHGWPRTCNNVKSSNMAELRRHLTKRPGRGYTAQLAFLELCPTCNEDFLDSDVFQTRHGYKGELCNSRRPQRKGEKAKEQWELLYRQVEKELAVQHLPARKQSLFPTQMFRTNVLNQDQVNPDPIQPQPMPSLHDLGSYEPMDDPLSRPADVHQDPILPDKTPNQLVVDSESEERDIATSPRLVGLRSI